MSSLPHDLYPTREQALAAVETIEQSFSREVSQLIGEKVKKTLETSEPPWVVSFECSVTFATDDQAGERNLDTPTELLRAELVKHKELLNSKGFQTSLTTCGPTYVLRLE
jgi:NADH pyrophosphatase NudC (nudix superfamily)